MKLSVTTILLLLLAISVSLAHGAPAIGDRDSTPPRITVPESGNLLQQGVLFSSKEGRFSIRLSSGFPTFEESTNNQTTGVGVIELHTFISGIPRGACIVGYSDFPPPTFDGRTPEKILEDARDGALKNVNGTLEQQEHTTVQGYPALVIYGRATAEGRPIFIRFHFVLVKPRAYQLGFLTYDRGSLEGLEVEAYFKSFRLEQGGPAPH
jgi:hypothetical protein